MAVDDSLVPSNNQKLAAEQALVWVLYALFAYAPYLRISTVIFW